MKKTMTLSGLYMLSVLLAVAAVFAASASYSLQVHFDGQNFSVERLSLVEVSPMPISQDGEYTIALLSSKEAMLFESTFYADLRILDAEREFVDDRSFDFILPYHANGKSITIFKGHERMLEVDLSHYTQCNENGNCEGRESLKHCPSDCTCGNGICDDDENYAFCQQDCASGQDDGVCDGAREGICDPDCSLAVEESQNPSLIVEDYDCEGKREEEDYGQELKVVDKGLESPSSVRPGFRSWLLPLLFVGLGLAIGIMLWRGYWKRLVKTRRR